MSQSQPSDPTTTTTSDLNGSAGSESEQSASTTSENAPAQPTGTTSSTDATTTTEPTHPAHDEQAGSNGSGGSGETLGADTPGEASTTVKDPSEWVTGDEPMTGAQRSYLDTLAREAGEQLPADLNKAQASEHIDRLQEKTGRGAS